MDSVIKQTYQNLEIICVNDGSTDGSVEIIKQYMSMDHRVRIVNKENGGLSSARNAGMKIASGDLITFIDSDDWIELDTYEKCIDRIINVDILVFGTNVVYDDNVNVNDGFCNYFNLLDCEEIELNDEVRKKINVCAWNKIYKMSIIKQYNIHFPDGLIHEDDCFYWVYTLRSTTMGFLNEKKYNYYQRSDSITRTEDPNTIPMNSILILESMLSMLTVYEVKDHKTIFQNIMSSNCNKALDIDSENRVIFVKKALSISDKYGLSIPNELIIKIMNNHEDSLIVCESYKLNNKLHKLMHYCLHSDTESASTIIESKDNNNEGNSSKFGKMLSLVKSRLCIKRK